MHVLAKIYLPPHLLMAQISGWFSGRLVAMR